MRSTVQAWFVASIVLLQWTTFLSADKTRPRVAVVGGGIGGSTAALFLRDELGEDVDVVVFEGSGRVGGRLKTVKVGARFYEAGGAVIHPSNLHMKNLTARLGLSRAADGPGFNFGLYDGQNVVFQLKDYPVFGDWINKFRLLWRYGFDLFRLNPWIQGVLNWYAQVYPFQESKRTFDSVYQLFHSCSPIFDDLVASSIGDYLGGLGFGDRFVKELARIAMRTNYGQDLGIQGFVGAVSLAGAQPGLWAVEGGNYRVAEEALKASGAALRREKVTQIEEANNNNNNNNNDNNNNDDSPASTPHFHVTSTPVEGGPASTEDFDAVVLAVPCTAAGCGDIEFLVDGLADKFRTFPNAYHRTVANFVKGRVDPSQFGVKDSSDFPDCLYSVSEEPLVFNSLCRQVPVDFDPDEESTDPRDFPVWKIFSSVPWTKHHVNRFFLDHAEFVVEDWAGAYPEYDALPLDNNNNNNNDNNNKNKNKNNDVVAAALPPFVLNGAGGLVSVNAVEKSASAMEQSVLGAKNAALLVARFLRGAGK